MTLWVLGILALVVLAAGLCLRYAIAQNGPAVLDTVDRIAGGARDTELKARISTGDHPEQKLFVWGPESRAPSDAPAPVLIFAHGGSWRSGDPVDYGFVARAFVPEGFIVVLAGYRLGEAGRYPAMLEDTARAIAWTHEEIAAYGGDPDRIVVAGHSAGAYNVVMTTLEEQWLGRRGLPADAIAGVVGLSGPYDFVPLASESTIASFGHLSDPMITQPTEHIRDDAPPKLFIHGEQDTLVRPRNSRLLAEALNAGGARAAAHFYPDMDHNAPLISLAAPWRSNRDVARRIAEFARDPKTSVEQVAEQTSVPVQAETR